MHVICAIINIILNYVGRGGRLNTQWYGESKLYETNCINTNYELHTCTRYEKICTILI